MPASSWPPRTSTALSRGYRPAVPRSPRSRPSSPTGYGIAPCATPRATSSASTRSAESALERIERRVVDLEQRVHHEVGQREGGMLALALFGHGDAGHG